MSPEDPGPSQLELAPSLTIEDHGDAFYLVMQGDGHDVTLSLDEPVADALAQFVLHRLRIRSGVTR